MKQESQGQPWPPVKPDPPTSEEIQQYHQDFHEASAAPYMGGHSGRLYTVCGHPSCRSAARGRS